MKSARIIKLTRHGGLFPWLEAGSQKHAAFKNHAGIHRIPRWKRALDLTLVGLSLPLWLPLMAAIAVAILIVSPGPVFFRQERIGLRGKRFQCYKFRSMKTGAETRSHEHYLEDLIRSDRPMTKLDASNDPRLIPFGKIFRATGLDELPQLWNVIRGEMSLVGPRPCTAGEYEHYSAWQRGRFNAPPGLTGYWQVNGKNKTTFSEMIAMDVFYADNMSAAMDLGILFKTFPVLLMQVLETRIGKREAIPSKG